MIKLTVSKEVENPNYEEEKERNMYSNYNNIPNKFFDVEILKVELTEEEYKAIKKAVLEVK